MSAPASPFADARDLLTGGQAPRVWSLIVTIFGDMAQGEGARIEGRLLGDLCALIGIRPEAMRVALHRLRKDGWIESSRDGRSSSHALTPFGRAQSAEASPRIYAAALPDMGPMHLMVAGDAPEAGRAELEALAQTDGYLTLNRATLLGMGPAPAAPGPMLAADLSPDHLPGWLHRMVCPPDLSAACAALDDALGRVRVLLGDGVLLAPSERVVLRALVIHGWRRVLWRHPDLPRPFFPDDWHGPACRDHVQALLRLFGGAHPVALDTLMADQTDTH